MARDQEQRQDEYPGGKGHSYRKLINLMPPHDRYIETHVGGGAVLRHKLPARMSIGIDIDGRVVARWRRRPLCGIEILHGCAIDLLPSLDLGPKDLVYCDPPYIPATRRTPRYYRHDYDEADHRRLLDALLGLKSMVIVSGYRHALYDETLSGWSRVEYDTQTHHGVVKEVAWLNFEPGPVLHDYRYVGETFRDRERFRRRASALARRLTSAADVELNAALATLAVERPDVIRAAAVRCTS